MTTRALRPQEVWLVVLAASAGGISAVQTILSSLPATFPASLVIVLPHPGKPESMLERILSRSCALPISTARFGDAIRPGCVYITRPDLHLTIGSARRFGYQDGRRVRGVVSSASRLLESAADVFREHLVGVVLTGSGIDATDGVQCVKARGGMVIVQDPTTARDAGMPASAVTAGAIDRVLPLEAIAPALIEIATGTTATNGERAM
jgi:two-component system chemotaxis response regulator CheB